MAVTATGTAERFLLDGHELPVVLIGAYRHHAEYRCPYAARHATVGRIVKHSPKEKLIDSLIGILAGCKALYELNVEVRPDLPLQRAFGREDGCADQSTIQQTLNAFSQRTCAQLREAVEAIHRRYSKIYSHDFEEEMLMVEVDLTGLSASKDS